MYNTITRFGECISNHGGWGGGGVKDGKREEEFIAERSLDSLISYKEKLY